MQLFPQLEWRIKTPFALHAVTGRCLLLLSMGLTTTDNGHKIKVELNKIIQSKQVHKSPLNRW